MTFSSLSSLTIILPPFSATIADAGKGALIIATANAESTERRFRHAYDGELDHLPNCSLDFWEKICPLDPDNASE